MEILFGGVLKLVYYVELIMPVCGYTNFNHNISHTILNFVYLTFLGFNISFLLSW